MKRTKIMLVFTLTTLALLLTACSGFGAPATPDPAVMQATLDAAVTQAMQTMSAQLTATALAQPTATETLVPTATATLEPSPTVVIPTATKTWIPATAAPTKTATAVSYGCTLVSTSPAAGSKINLSSGFDAVWVVKNTGVINWEIGGLDLRYDSGTKMQKVADIFDINTLVKPGEELTLIVDMVAPSTADNYKASWKLMYGNTTLCTLPVSIAAVQP